MTLTFNSKAIGDRLFGMDMSPGELTAIVRALTKAVLLQQAEIHALESALASVGVVPVTAITNARQHRMDSLESTLVSIPSGRRDDLVRVIENAFPAGPAGA